MMMMLGMLMGSQACVHIRRVHSQDTVPALQGCALSKVLLSACKYAHSVNMWMLSRSVYVYVFTILVYGANIML